MKTVLLCRLLLHTYTLHAVRSEYVYHTKNEVVRVYGMIMHVTPYPMSEEEEEHLDRAPPPAEPGGSYGHGHQGTQHANRGAYRLPLLKTDHVEPGRARKGELRNLPK